MYAPRFMVAISFSSNRFSVSGCSGQLIVTTSHTLTISRTSEWYVRFSSFSTSAGSLAGEADRRATGTQGSDWAAQRAAVERERERERETERGCRETKCSAHSSCSLLSRDLDSSCLEAALQAALPCGARPCFAFSAIA